MIGVSSRASPASTPFVFRSLVIAPSSVFSPAIEPSLPVVARALERADPLARVPALVLAAAEHHPDESGGDDGAEHEEQILEGHIGYWLSSRMTELELVPAEVALELSRTPYESLIDA